MMELTKAERDLLAALAEDIDQDARYRDATGRTLTEIQQDSVKYRLDPRREGIMFYDNANAELAAKRRDPRYTNYQ